MSTRGRFITLEGGEGAGKSTQVRRLVARLGEHGIAALATREPGGAPGAEAIRKLLVASEAPDWSPAAEALLMTAARADHVEHTIEPALAAGKWVVSDRFFDSSVAYQGIGRGYGADEVRRLQRLALGNFAPDLTLILDLDPETGLARAGRREAETGDGEDRFEKMGGDFHRTLREAFHTIAQREPGRCLLIDADGDEDTVAGRLWEAVTARLLPEAA